MGRCWQTRSHLDDGNRKIAHILSSVTVDNLQIRTRTYTRCRRRAGYTQRSLRTYETKDRPAKFVHTCIDCVWWCISVRLLCMYNVCFRWFECVELIRLNHLWSDHDLWRRMTAEARTGKKSYEFVLYDRKYTSTCIIYTNEWIRMICMYYSSFGEVTSRSPGFQTITTSSDIVIQ